MTEFHPAYICERRGLRGCSASLIFVVAFVIVDKMTPYHLWKEIVRGARTWRWRSWWARCRSACASSSPRPCTKAGCCLIADAVLLFSPSS